MATTRVFISYRRDDSKWPAKMLYEKLHQLEGIRVFMDTEGIRVGEDFVAKLQEQVDRCNVFIALIGDAWATARLRDRRDFVHIEIARALEKDKAVIPVLLDKTPMPKDVDVPYALDGLLRLQAHSLHLDSYDADLEELVQHIRSVSVRASGRKLLHLFRRAPKRKQIEAMFGGRLNEDAIDELLSDLADDRTAEVSRRQLTMMFCGMLGFTSFSEAMNPEDSVSHLSDVMTPFTDAIIRRRGMVDKCLADWIQAFWNAPLDDPMPEANACAAALDMQDTLARINEEYADIGGGLRAGIGIVSGECVVGPMGSRRRPEYSCFGDTVDFSSRLQGLTKVYGLWTLVDQATAKKVDTRFAVVEVDRILVKGHAMPRDVFALLGDESVSADAAYKEFARQYESARGAYLAQDWDRAEEYYRAAEAMKVDRVDTPTLCYAALDRTKALRANPPPEDWDGVFRWEGLRSK